MSTADSQLLVLTSALTEDLPLFKRFTTKQRAWISRLGVVGFALLAYYLASDSNDTILMMVGYAWGGFGATFGPVIILSLIWRKTTKYGALAGMLAGAATIFVVKNYITLEGDYLYELLPGFIIAFLTVILVSALTEMPSEEALRKFDAARQQVKSSGKAASQHEGRIK
jgi:sodium/proline symporter